MVNRVDIEVAVSTPMLLILEQGFKIIKHIRTHHLTLSTT